MKKSIGSMFLLFVLLTVLVMSGCAPAPTPEPTHKPVPPTITPSPVPPSTPVSTSTHEATPTQEVKQFPICTPENYKNCTIPYQDLFNGNYFNWLNSLPVTPFDPSIVKEAQCKGNPTTHIKMSMESPNPETSMFRLGITYAFTTIQPGEVGYDFPQTRNYLVLPVYVYSKSLSHGAWNIIVLRTDGNEPTFIEKYTKEWQNSNLLTIITSEFSELSPSDNLYARNPLTVNTFKMYPDIQERFNSFAESCDPAYISAPGIILSTKFIAK